MRAGRTLASAYILYRYATNLRPIPCSAAAPNWAG